MILLFGEKAQNSQTRKNTGLKNINNPVENSGILAMSGKSQLSFLNASEYDDFIASNPVAINYEAYSEWSESLDCGFMSGFSDAIATIDGGFADFGSYGSSDGGFAGACADCGCSCGGGFSSVC